MIDDNCKQNFKTLDYQQQLKTLLNIDNIDALQRIFQGNSDDAEMLSQKMVQWFEKNMVHNKKLHNNSRAAIQIQRKFAPLLNKSFSQSISKYFLKLMKTSIQKNSLENSKIINFILQLTPRVNLDSDSASASATNCCALSVEESRYLYDLTLKSDLSDLQTQTIDALLEELTPGNFSFETIEAMILIVGNLHHKEILEKFTHFLNANPSANKQHYLLNLQFICEAFVISNKAIENILINFFEMPHKQQETTIFELAIELRNHNLKARGCFFNTMTLMPDKSPTEFFSTIINTIEGIESCYYHDWVEFLSNDIPHDKRSFLFSIYAPHTELKINFETLRAIFTILSLLPESRAERVAAIIIKAFNAINDHWKSNYYYKEIKKIITKYDVELKLIDFFQEYSHLLFKPSHDKYCRTKDAIFDFFNVLLTLTKQHLLEAVQLIIKADASKINSINHLIGLLKTLLLFPQNEHKEIISHIIPILETNPDCLATSLEAFPQEQRKNILLQALPYLKYFTIGQSIAEFILSIGLSHCGEKSISGVPIEISGAEKVISKPLLTVENLRKREYSSSLVAFMARYLGDEKLTMPLQTVSQWIQHSALHVFLNPALFFREISANAFDAQLRWKKQIGNFGMGFFSIFSLFYQAENPIEQIEIDTCYLKDEKPLAYRILFTKAEEELHVRFKMIDTSTPEPPLTLTSLSKTLTPLSKACSIDDSSSEEEGPESGRLDKIKFISTGTSINILPKEGSTFSQAFLKSLKDTLQDFRYFEHGYAKVNDHWTIGNAQSGIHIDIKLQSDQIKVSDCGRGIPLEKIHYLLLPSLSDKRRLRSQALAMPTPQMSRAIALEDRSAVVFTLNSVVNTVYPLNWRFYDSTGNLCNLIIEMPKPFKPNLSRDSIEIPGQKSLQAKAVCKMIKQTLKGAFKTIRKDANQLLMLYLGLLQWENKGLPKDLNGFFTTYFQKILRQEFRIRPQCMPCPDHEWLQQFNKYIFADQAVNYIPLPLELIKEGYTRFEMALVKAYQEKVVACATAEEKLILEPALHRQMIEGQSICFLADKWLHNSENNHLYVSSGPCSGIIFAPISFLKDNATFKDVQRKICQQYSGHGKRIKAAATAESSPLFASHIYIPTPSFQVHSSYLTSRNEELIRSAHEQADYYLQAPLMRALDKQRCATSFWNYFPKLVPTLKKTAWNFNYERGSSMPHSVFFEDATTKEAFGFYHNHTIEWQRWFKEAILIDPDTKRAYKIRQADPSTENAPHVQENITEMINGITSFHQKQDCGKRGNEVLPFLQRKYSANFETVPADELFKRLGVILFLQWGIDPYQEETLFCWMDGIKKPIDIEVLEKAISSFLVDPKEQNPNTRVLFFAASSFNAKQANFATKIAPFAALLSNLKVYLNSQQTIDLVQNFADLYLLQNETPSYCAIYFEQLFEVYYRYLLIPAEEFPYCYGTTNRLRISIHDSYYSLSDSIELLNKIPHAQTKKLLQEWTAKLTQDLDPCTRAHNLQNDSLEISTIKGFNVLGLLTLFYNKEDDNIPLMTSLLTLASTHEEIVGLTCIIYFARQFHPKFFKAPLSYQKECLKIILTSILRNDDSSKINTILKNSYESFLIIEYTRSYLPSSINAGIDSIGIFTTRYQAPFQLEPQLFQDPDNLFKQADIAIFSNTHLMQTLFHSHAISEIFRSDDLKGLLKLMQQTGATDKFNEFGMINHSTSHGQGYTTWQRPWIELIKNSLSACGEKNDRHQGGDGRLTINYAVTPHDAEHSQLIGEVRDNAGFENLEALICLLIPGYHPKGVKQLGLGFFQMLRDVSIVHYRTSLQSAGSGNKAISLLVKPIRDVAGAISSLQIGIQNIAPQDAPAGTICRIYMQKQTHVEAWMRLKQTHHFVHEIISSSCLQKPLNGKNSISINGEKHEIKCFDPKGQKINIDTPIANLFGETKDYSSKPVILMIEGIPQPVSLDQFLQSNGILDAAFSKKFHGGFISFPKECFRILQNSMQPILNDESLQEVHKFILNWMYIHIFDTSFTIDLEHFKSKGPIDQLIAKPQKLLGNAKEIITKLAKEQDYHTVFSHYSYSGQIEVEGKMERIRVPSFSEYLFQVYKEVYLQWLKMKCRNKYTFFDLFIQWEEKNIDEFDRLAGNSSFSRCNKQLLELVEHWYTNKFNSNSHEPFDTPHISGAHPRNSTASAALDHFIFTAPSPEWLQAKNFVEEILTYYAREVMSEKVKVTATAVKLCCTNENFEGEYQENNNKIFINIKFFPFSQLLLLLESLERKIIDAHYIGELLHSEIPSQAGALNHEIYHALKHALGEDDHGHEHSHGVNFEVCARDIANIARAHGVLTKLESKIHECLLQNEWTADSLHDLIVKAKHLEAKIA